MSLKALSAFTLLFHGKPKPTHQSRQTANKTHPNSIMNNYMPQTTPSPSPAAFSPAPSSSSRSSSGFSLIPQRWRDSADADFQLIRDRANSFKNLASSFDRELENFFNSASTFSVPAAIASSPATEIDFVKRLRPKLSEFRRAYSSPQFSRKVLEKWYRQAKIRIDLSAIRNAIVEEVDVEERERVRRRRRRRIVLKDFKWDLRGHGDKEKGFSRDWEPVRAIKTGLREFEKAFRREPQDSKEVPPLDVSELLAYWIKQSEPLLDHLGVRRDVCNKIVGSFCSKSKMARSLSTGDCSIIEGDKIIDELDLRIASVVQSTGHHYEGGFWSDSGKCDQSDRKRHVAIVTTASLPWMTGTAVNPLFRAAYLAKSANQNVTLLVPWLCKSDQQLVYPNNLTFESTSEQETYIRNWLEERIGFKANFKISFYPGKFSKERRSIIPTGDTTLFIPSKEADIAILEEPEHLNWYHHGRRWTDKFNHVVGIVHTNYLEYIKREKNGALQAFFVKHINNLVIRAHCDKVLRLSAATQDMPKSTVCNVHGVNPKFLKIGEKMASERALGQQAFSKGAYFLGKMVWAKGYKELIDLLSKHKNELDGFSLDVFGNGEDAHEVQSMAKKLNLSVNFEKGRDHTDDSLHGYKVFINPSISDVVCTATAEALAMGKLVVCVDHPSNDFFRSFHNCLTYKTSEDFVAKVKEALANEPQPLTPEERYQLSWEAATERFLGYSELDNVLKVEQGSAASTSSQRKPIMKSISMPSMSEIVDGGLALVHYCCTGNEILRLATGAIPGTREYDKQHCRDLHLLPPQVESPIYGW
ncbi:Digalactosyldiacylglycerol synthase 1, chloroplastic [Dionaea muscipula]